MRRKSAASVRAKLNLRALRIYPTEQTLKSVSELETVGFKLSKSQAIDLARILLLVSQDWDEIDITCYRLRKRRVDGTYHITVTSMR